VIQNSYIEGQFLTEFPNRNLIISRLSHFLLKVDKFGYVLRGTAVCRTVENIDLFQLCMEYG